MSSGRVNTSINVNTSGTYYLVGECSFFTLIGGFGGCVTFNAGATLSYSYMPSRLHTFLGRDGFGIRGNAQNLFHQKFNGNVLTTNLRGVNNISGTTTITGAFNAPGVLRAAAVNSDGTSTNAWGSTKADAKRMSTGKYRITHYIGHTSYFFSGTLTGGFTGAVTIISRQSSYIDVEIRGLDNNLYDVAFDYIICGKNGSV